MASFVIHHIVGSKVLSILENEYGINLSERQKQKFLLGNLIADSSKFKLEIKEGATVEEKKEAEWQHKRLVQAEKKETHFRSDDDANLCIQSPVLEKFTSKYENLLERNISSLGYLAHLYTDKYWFEDLFPRTFETVDDSLKATNYLKEATKIRVIKTGKVYGTKEFWGYKGEGSIYEDYTIMNRMLLEGNGIIFDTEGLISISGDFRNPGIEEIDYNQIVNVIKKTADFIKESYEMEDKPLSVFKTEDVQPFIEMCARNFIEDNLEYLKSFEAKNVVFASNNKNKLKEVREILEPFGFEVLSLRDVNVDIDPEETGMTFSENALLKAEAIYNEIVRVNGVGVPVIADDTGLCINSLDGLPGVMSKRFGPSNWEEKNDLLIKMVNEKGIDRTAFVITAIGYFNGKNSFVHESGIPGLITEEQRGENGFGYDPIFVPGINNQELKTMAEMSSEEKNLVNSRGVALRESVEKIIENSMNHHTQTRRK